jgi:hypothetical protein
MSEDRDYSVGAAFQPRYHYSNDFYDFYDLTNRPVDELTNERIPESLNSLIPLIPQS